MRLSHGRSINIIALNYQLSDNVINTFWGLVVVRKYILLLMTALFLVACRSSDESVVAEDEKVEELEELADEEDEIETLSSEDKDLLLFDNDSVKLELTMVNHGRANVADFISLHTNITNKQNRTYEVYIKDLEVDGREIDMMHIWLTEEELEPNAYKAMVINGYEYEELSIKEHVAGTIIYRDYEGNRNELEFNEYINE